MRSLKSLAYGLASIGGAPRLLQRVLDVDGAAILMYHAVTKQRLPVSDWCFVEEHQFRDQMIYLKDRFQVVPLRDVPSALAARGPRPIVALTFDDGFQNNHGVAFPILRELGLPATIFLATNFINTDDTPWFCRVNEALSRTSLTRLDWDGKTYDLSTPHARARANAALQSQLKALKHKELLESSRDLIEVLGCDFDAPLPSESPYRMLRESEVRAMSRSGLVDFGAHTCSHAILNGLPEPVRRREIADSISAVSRLTGSACKLFAYPNGRISDYGIFDVTELRSRQIEIAVTTVDGPVGVTEATLEMRRYGIGADTSLAMFKLVTHHVVWKLRNSLAHSGH